MVNLALAWGLLRGALSHVKILKLEINIQSPSNGFRAPRSNPSCLEARIIEKDIRKRCIELSHTIP